MVKRKRTQPAMAKTALASRTRARRKEQPGPSYHELPTDEMKLPWTSGEQYSLLVVQQPEHEFYKDQGGKNHHLVALVRLVPSSRVDAVAKACQEGAEAGRPLPLDQPSVKLPIKPTLLFESGKQVTAEYEVHKKILEMMHGDPEEMPVLEMRHTEACGWCYEGEVKFRLEKVSFRLDGQRLMLQLDLHDAPALLRKTHKHVLLAQDRDPHDHTAVADVYRQLEAWVPTVKGSRTAPICVLSKKKHHTEGQSQSRPRATSHAHPTRAAANGSHSSTPAKRARVDVHSAGGAAVTGSGSGGTRGGGGDLEHVLHRMEAALEQVLDVVTRSERRLGVLEATVHQLHHSSPSTCSPAVDPVIHMQHGATAAVEDASDASSMCDESAEPDALGGSDPIHTLAAAAAASSLSQPPPLLATTSALLASQLPLANAGNSVSKASLRRTNSAEYAESLNLPNPLRSVSGTVDLPISQLIRCSSWGSQNPDAQTTDATALIDEQPCAADEPAPAASAVDEREEEMAEVGAVAAPGAPDELTDAIPTAPHAPGTALSPELTLGKRRHQEV